MSIKIFNHKYETISAIRQLLLKRNDVRKYSNAILFKFEWPDDQDPISQSQRNYFDMKYYNRFKYILYKSNLSKR